MTQRLKSSAKVSKEMYNNSAKMMLATRMMKKVATSASLGDSFGFSLDRIKWLEEVTVTVDCEEEEEEENEEEEEEVSLPDSKIG